MEDPLNQLNFEIRRQPTKHTLEDDGDDQPGLLALVGGSTANAM